MSIRHLCGGLVLVGLACAVFDSHAQDRRIPRTAAQPDHAIVYADQTVLIDVLANDGALGPDLEITHVGSPAHGSMVIEDNQLRYTPPVGMSGFRDQGGYMVRSSNGNTAMGLVTVDVVAPTATLHLTGRVPGVEPTCSLEAVVAGTVVNACVDAQGRYALTLHDVPLESVVQLRLSARTVGGSVGSRWMSLPGSVAQLLEKADGSGRVDEARFPMLAITPFTTVQSALITALHGGSVPSDPHHLSDLRQVADAIHVYRTGGLFHAILRDQVDLPAGVSDAFELAADVHLSAQLVTTHWPHVEDALSELSTLPGATVAYDAGLSADFVSSVGGSPSAWAVGRGGSHHFEFGSGGQGRHVSHVASSSDAMAWALGSHGGIEISDAPLDESVSFPLFSCPGSGSIQVEVRSSTQVVGITRALSAPEGDVVALRHWTEVTNRDTFPVDCQPPASVEDRFYDTAIMLVPRNIDLDVVSLAGLGEVGVLVRAPDQAAQIDTNAETRVGGVLDFDHLLADIPGFEPSFTAAPLSDGRLRIELQATPEFGGEGLTLHVRRARGPRNGAEQWAQEFVTSSGWHFAEHTLAVPVVDASDILVPDALVGFWEHGFHVSAQGSAMYQPGTSFYWAVPSDAPDTMIQMNVYEGVPSAGTRYFFNPASGDINATAIMHAGEWRRDCPVNETNCFGFKRVWEPLAVVEVNGKRRVYMIEALSWWQASDRTWDLLSRRMNFIEERDSLPGGGVAQPVPVSRKSSR